MQNSPLTTQQIQIQSTAYPVVSEPEVGEPEAWTKVAKAGAGYQVEVVKLKLGPEVITYAKEEWIGEGGQIVTFRQLVREAFSMPCLSVSLFSWAKAWSKVIN